MDRQSLDQRTATTSVDHQISWRPTDQRTTDKASRSITSGTQSGRISAVSRHAGSRRRHITVACTGHAIRRCIDLVYPLRCLDVPLGVQTSYAAKCLAGVSPIVRSTCIKTLNMLVAKQRSEMAAAIPYRQTKHLAAKRSMASRQSTGAASEFVANVSARRNTPGDFQVHPEPVLLDNVSQVAETASLLSPEHQSALTDLAYPSMPQMSPEEVEQERQAIEETTVKEREIPLEELQRRYKVKRAPRQPDNNVELITNTSEIFAISSQLFDDMKYLHELPFNINAQLLSNHIIITALFVIKYQYII